MITALILLGVFLVLMVIRLALKLAWSILKFIFGLGLFALCPVLFVLLGVLGILGTGWWIVLLIALFCGIGFTKA